MPSRRRWSLGLPALLVITGRWIFWPLVPRVGDRASEGRLWGRLLGAGLDWRLLGQWAAVLPLGTLMLVMTMGWHDPEAVRGVTEAVVTWSIVAYYDR